MIKFAEYYLNIATAIENTLESSEILQEIAQDIATGKAKSLSQAKCKTSFIINKSISLVINQDLDNIERLKSGAKEFLKGFRKSERICNEYFRKILSYSWYFRQGRIYGIFETLIWL